MAHVAKYKREQVGALMRHYLRQNKSYSNENISPALSEMNYGWLGSDDPQQHLFERLNAFPRKPRKDAVVMCDWVVTLPEDVHEEDSDKFFETVVDFLHNRYGLDNLLCAEVHLDESRPHIHYAWMPITEDGRLCAKDVLNRNDLKSFHGDLNKTVDNALGYHCSIELSDEKKVEKAISKLSHEDMKEAYKELDRLVEKKAELAVSVSAAATRLEELETDIQTLKEKKDDLEASVGVLEGRIRDLVEWYNDNLVPRFERLRSFIREGRFNEWVDELMVKLFRFEEIQEQVSFFDEMQDGVRAFQKDNSDLSKTDEPDLGSSDFDR